MELGSLDETKDDSIENIVNDDLILKRKLKKIKRIEDYRRRMSLLSELMNDKGYERRKLSNSYPYFRKDDSKDVLMYFPNGFSNYSYNSLVLKFDDRKEEELIDTISDYIDKIKTPEKINTIGNIIAISSVVVMLASIKFPDFPENADYILGGISIGSYLLGSYGRLRGISETEKTKKYLNDNNFIVYEGKKEFDREVTIKALEYSFD
ncbi:MAG: hypothetical protein ACLFPQ_04535 [Candidatus Woesearchaeota archaeon]